MDEEASVGRWLREKSALAKVIEEAKKGKAD